MHRIGKLLTKPSSRVLPFLLRESTRGYASRVEDATGSYAARAFGTQASEAAAAEPFLSGSSSTYVEEMYLAWQRDPNSVHKVRDALCNMVTGCLHVLRFDLACQACNTPLGLQFGFYIIHVLLHS